MSKNKPCPFCGGEVDPAGWLNGEGERGPECETCGATAPSLQRWNTRLPVQQEVPPMDSHSVACAKCGKTLTVRWSVGDEVSILGIICPCGHRTAINQTGERDA